ncbi:hypothetical protein L3Y34_006693 [Caenorhabditis briggsae]|nr:hypothetical protein L3Y34_006693 [Caenorhabditis briggsae]
MLVQYTIIIYCAVQMYLSMEEKLQIPSPSLRNLHNQFFKTLVLQIVTPTITLFSPVVSIIHLPMLNLELDLPTGIFLCAFTLYPAMDAIIVMYVVQDYRRAVKYSLRKLASPLYEWLVRNYGNPMESRSQTANVPNALY